MVEEEEEEEEEEDEEEEEEKEVEKEVEEEETKLWSAPWTGDRGWLGKVTLINLGTSLTSSLLFEIGKALNVFIHQPSLEIGRDHTAVSLLPVAITK